MLVLSEPPRRPKLTHLSSLSGSCRKGSKISSASSGEEGGRGRARGRTNLLPVFALEVRHGAAEDVVLQRSGMRGRGEGKSG